MTWSVPNSLLASYRTLVSSTTVHGSPGYDPERTCDTIVSCCGTHSFHLLSGAPPRTARGQIAASEQALHVRSSPSRDLCARRANGCVRTRPRSRFKLARSRRIECASLMRRDRARLNHDRGRVLTRPFASGARRSRDGDGLTCRACSEAAIWLRAVLGGAPLRKME